MPQYYSQQRQTFPEAAFDEISKILFIKIRYERSNSENQIFSKKQFQKLKAAYEET
jgi:type I restriction enzyme M protein